MKQETCPGLLFCPASRRGLYQRPTRVRPAERLGEHSIKFNSFVRKSPTEVNEPRRTTFRMITPNTTSIWFSHELCFGRYTNRMRWLVSDKNACRLATH